MPLQCILSRPARWNNKNSIVFTLLCIRQALRTQSAWPKLLEHAPHPFAVSQPRILAHGFNVAALPPRAPGPQLTAATLLDPKLKNEN